MALLLGWPSGVAKKDHVWGSGNGLGDTLVELTRNLDNRLTDKAQTEFMKYKSNIIKHKNYI